MRTSENLIFQAHPFHFSSLISRFCRLSFVSKKPAKLFGTKVATEVCVCVCMCVMGNKSLAQIPLSSAKKEVLSASSLRVSQGKCTNLIEGGGSRNIRNGSGLDLN